MRPLPIASDALRAGDSPTAIFLRNRTALFAIPLPPPGPPRSATACAFPVSGEMGITRVPPFPVLGAEHCEETTAIPIGEDISSCQNGVRFKVGESQCWCCFFSRRDCSGIDSDIALMCYEPCIVQACARATQGLPFLPYQLTTLGYVVVYFSILCVRYHAGIITRQMLELPKFHFILIGLLEALGVASGMAAGAMLPGPAISVLSQTFLVWQLILSLLILRRRYSLNQIFGCLLVAGGVVLAVASGANAATQATFIWPALMVASSALQAGASITKEFVFIDGAKHLHGKRPDIFVVNSFGSAFQALFVMFFLPFLSNMKGIPIMELPAYVRQGAACFLNLAGNLKGCEGAPLLPLLFITVNVTFNISLLNLLKMSSALVASLPMSLAVPISIYILSLPLPCMPQGTSLSASFCVGAAVLVTGLVLYNLPAAQNQLKKE